MSILTDSEREALLKLARSAIAAELDPGSPLEKPEYVSPSLQTVRGCFVTLQKRDILRGCVGTLEPHRPLIDAVEENARNAAFHDPRFPGLSADELDDVTLEISVLTIPRRLDFSDPDDLLHKLKPGVHGLVLTSGRHGATFLPQVWSQLPDKETFLGYLCQKAGLDEDFWKRGDIEIKVYEVEHFSE